MTRLIFLLVIVGLSKIAIAQVSNNNIQARLRLNLNSDPIFSSTAQSTVEWRCINKELTNKCLVYHNDQWFDFSVPTSGTYFINISGQNCRDLRGLQLIVIEGNPCETKTYRILDCIPKMIQDDVFVQLDLLKPKTQYLMNIDGFLGDFCEFGVQISEKPNGLPRTLVILDTIKAQAFRKGRLVNLEWTVDKDQIDRFQSFKIYRNKPTALKSDFIHEQSVSRNSYGAYILTYSVTDSLQKEGMYIYRIIGVQKQNQFLFPLAERAIEYQEPRPKAPLQKSITLNLDFKDEKSFKVLIYDETDNTMLRKQIEEFDEKTDHPFTIDLGEFIDKGLRQFMILISDEDSQEALQFHYFFNGERIVQK